jgi:nucleotide-binding universal stress UspA family protein
MAKIKRILVPIDFSKTSLKALDYAVDFAKPLGAEVHALFVVEPIYYAVPDLAGAAAGATVGLIEEQRQSGRQQLERLKARYARRHVKLRTLLQTGTPYQVIVDTAKSIKADMIVMSTHGRTGMTHLLVGSVAERVVRAASCPVLTIRVKGR